MRTATPAITQYVTRRRGWRGRLRRPARGGCHEPQRRLHLQPVAGEQDAGLAQQVHRGGDRARLSSRWPAAPPGSRCSAMTSSRSRAKCASPARWNCRPIAAASWTATGCCSRPACRCRASGRFPRTSSATARQAGAAGQAAGNAAGGTRQEARGRGQDLRLAQAPGRRARRAADRRARHQGHLPAQGIQAPVPRGRSRRARGGLHQRRGPRPGRHGARVQQGTGRQGPARAA